MPAAFLGRQGLSAGCRLQSRGITRGNFFNVVKHNTAASQISVDLSVADGVVTLVIEDDGSRFDPFSLSAVSIDGTIEERAVGGLGIHLVKEMMDSCTYAFIAEKNTATMSLAIEKVPDDAREKRRCD